MTRTSYRSVAWNALLRALLIAYLSTAVPTFGQPAANAQYDLTSTIEIRGEIAKAVGIPGGEAFLEVVAPDENGVTQVWKVDVGQSRDLRKAGVTPLTFAPGVQLSISGNPAASSAEHSVLAQKITLAGGFVWTRPESPKP